MRPIQLLNLSGPIETLGMVRRTLTAYHRGTEVLNPQLAIMYTDAASALDLAIQQGRHFNEAARNFNTKFAKPCPELEPHDAQVGG